MHGASMKMNNSVTFMWSSSLGTKWWAKTLHHENWCVNEKSWASLGTGYKTLLHRTAWRT